MSILLRGRGVSFRGSGLFTLRSRSERNVQRRENAEHFRVFRVGVGDEHPHAFVFGRDDELLEQQGRHTEGGATAVDDQRDRRFGRVRRATAACRGGGRVVAASPSQVDRLERTVRRCGSRASLISQVAEFHG